MAVTKEITEHHYTPTERIDTTESYTLKNSGTYTIQKILYYILGIVETLLALRFILKIFGANPASSFVSLVYSMSSVLVAPFISIFRNATTQGIETRSIFEPSTLVAIIIYALIFWGLAKLIDLAGES